MNGARVQIALRVPELLSKGDGFSAAVRPGAGEVLLSAGQAPAAERQGADASSQNPLKADMDGLLSHCRVRGVKTVLDLTRPHTDQDLLASADALRKLYRRGLDAALVSDLGVLRMVRMEAPELTVHWAYAAGPDALDMASALGCKRAVLAPSLSLAEIGALCSRKGDLEIQVSVWEPSCAASPLAPCLLSQPGARGAACEARRCRDAFTYGKGGEPALDLPGVDRIAQIAELSAMGIDVFGLYPSHPEETDDLLQAIRLPLNSTQTEGETVQNPVRVRFRFRLTPGRPAHLAVDDFEGHTLSVTGPEPRRVRGLQRSAEEAAYNTRLYQLGGTPYRCVDAKSRVMPGCSIPIEAFTRMKDALLRKLDKARGTAAERKSGRFRAGVRYLPRHEEPLVTARVRELGQVTRELMALYPALLYVPLAELGKDPEDSAQLLRWAREYGVPVAAELPYRLDGVTVRALKAARAMGIAEAAARRPEQLDILRKLGFRTRADFAACNSQALKELKTLGAASATLSPALALQTIRDMSHVMDTELVVYGRRPLLVSETCLIRRGGLCGCEARTELTDAGGAPYPVVRESPGHASVLLDEAKLWLLGHVRLWRRIGLWAARLDFTTENARECVQTLERHVGIGRYEPNRVTVGRYLEESI